LNETTSAAGSTLRVGRSKLKVLANCWLLPVATGVLMALAFPPFNFGQLGWIALIPLLFALEDCAPSEAFRRGYIAGVVFFALTIWWIVHVTLPGMVALVAFLALYFGLGALWFAIVAAKLLRGVNEPRIGFSAKTTDSAIRNMATALIGSAGWITLEWLRGKLLFGGFPWNFLGVSQWRAVPLIQFASATGVYGVSALACFVNFAFYFTVQRYIRQLSNPGEKRRLSWELYAAMTLIGLAFWHGIRTVFPKEPSSSRVMRLALVQGNIPQTLKFEPEQKPMILERYRTLTETAAGTQVDLIIWPETATPEPLRYDPESLALVTNLAVKAHAPLLTGTIDLTPYSSPAEVFNGAILVRPDGSLGEIYHKIHLVPFGEYVPLRKIVPFFKWLTPITDSFERGHEFTLFHLDELRFGVVICFEDTVPEVYRRFIQRGADFMVNLTNDAWFKDSPAAEMHLANAVFRCAETHRPLVRCTNNGVTCVVDEFGFVKAKTQLTAFKEGSLVCTLAVPHNPGMTFYAEHGDWAVGLCAIVTGLTVALSLRRKKPLDRAS
jgi:apolipoprotein N-acyltransferase